MVRALVHPSTGVTLGKSHAKERSNGARRPTVYLWAATLILACAGLAHYIGSMSTSEEGPNVLPASDAMKADGTAFSHPNSSRPFAATKRPIERGGAASSLAPERLNSVVPPEVMGHHSHDPSAEKALRTSRSSAVEQKGDSFPVSASVRKTCDEISHLGPASCAETDAELLRLQNEPLDPSWSSAMESLLSKLVAEDPGSQIRRIDCRTTVCALEVESARVFRVDDRLLEGKLTWVDQHYGYEKTDSGDMMKVALVLFRRAS
jgi:hypothetical protein